MSGVLVALVAIGAVTDPVGVVARFYTSPILLEFVAGIWIAWLVMEKPTPSRAVCLMLGTGALAVIVAFTRFAPIDLFERGWDLNNRVLTFGIAAAPLVYAAAAAELNGGRITSRWILAQGDASYSIYLVHPFVYQLFTKIIWRFSPPDTVWDRLITFAIILGAVAILGRLMNRLVEKPLTQALQARQQPRWMG